MAQRQLFQNAKFTIKHPKTGKECNFFMTGTSEMPTEVFEEIFQNDKFKAGQIFQSI
ncbi:MAG: hypothetical protein WEB89_05430 [Balneolales bacterium]